jgi:endonuclease/exonuclease/phosphatase family metal-dependent hydrolase
VASAGWFLANRLTAGSRTVVTHELSAGEGPPSDGATLRIATWNVSRCRGQAPGYDPKLGGSPEERRNRAAEMGRLLLEEQIDVAVLTEVDFGSSWSGGVDHAREIAVAGAFRWMVQIRNEDFALPWMRIKGGMAVLSRFPVVATEEIELPNPDGWQQWVSGSLNPWSPVQKRYRYLTKGQPMFGLRRSAAVDLELPRGQVVRVAGFHWPSRSRALQQAMANRCIELVAESPFPMILAGDFNLEPRSLRASASPDNALDELLDATSHVYGQPGTERERLLSFPASAPVKAIDHVLMPATFNAKSSHTIQTLLSDHLPVIVAVSFSVNGRGNERSSLQQKKP